MKRIWVIGILAGLVCGCVSGPPRTAQQRASDDAFYAGLAQSNAAMNSGGYSAMPTPQVAPIGQPGTRIVRCLNTGGGYVRCY